MKRRECHSGFTVAELMISIGVFAMLSVVLFGAMRFGINSWRSIDSRHEATNAIYKAQVALKRDLQQANTDFMGVAQVGSGSGDAIWFLSAEDPTADPKVGARYRWTNTGQPRWQRNVIYYLVRPGDHNIVSNGTSCSSSGGSDGDSNCPHKFLIRKVVNGPDDAEGNEILLSDSAVTAYLTAPNGYNFSSMTGESGVENVRLVTDKMLWFNVVNFTPGASLLEVELAAVRVQEAHKNIPVGQASMLASRFTQGQTMFIDPRNKGED